MVKDAAGELQSLFRSMRAGGVVVAIGAVAGKYRRIYKGVNNIAKREVMERITQRHSRIPYTYTDVYTARIKAVYQRVWDRLETSAVGLDTVKAQLPCDLWDPKVALHGPEAFGLRVFRRMNIKPGRHSWYRHRAAVLWRRATRNNRHWSIPAPKAPVPKDT
jgi:hypothetical protein